MATFGPKPWVNPFFKKSQFFDLLNFFYIFWKGVLPQNIFLAYIAKKKLEKWLFLDQ